MNLHYISGAVCAIRPQSPDVVVYTRYPVSPRHGRGIHRQSCVTCVRGSPHHEGLSEPTTRWPGGTQV